MQDFTIWKYIELVDILLENNYSFKKVDDYFKILNSKFKDDTEVSSTRHLTLEKIKNQRNIILRHDIDDHPKNALCFARIQSSKKIFGTYYFRAVSQSYDESVIKEIHDLGHEVGYHYETMDTFKGDVDKAYDEFCRNLEKFQKLTSVKTISMHGSPMSPYDNREIWKKYDYKKLGIIAEPYFDMHFNELFYITDTGRRWDGHLYNVRDKATKENPITNPDFLKLRFHSTHDIIKAVENNQFPKQAMLNFHPQRWNNKPIPWMIELIWQNIKNQGKRIIVSLRK